MHLKRYNIETYWKMGKKGDKFAIRPRAGPHKIGNCMPLLVVLRDILGIAKTGREGSRIIKSGEIMVDKKVRKDPSYPVGLMDVLEIPKTKQYYRVIVNGKGLTLDKIKEEEADRKTARIQGKTKIKKNRVQINLHDGRNVIVDKDVYKSNDSVVIKLPEQKILKHYKYEKGSPAVIISGRNMGLRGKIKNIHDRKTMLETSRVVLETKSGDIETVKEYVFVGEI